MSKSPRKQMKEILVGLNTCWEGLFLLLKELQKSNKSEKIQVDIELCLNWISHFVSALDQFEILRGSRTPLRPAQHEASADLTRHF